MLVNFQNGAWEIKNHLFIIVFLRFLLSSSRCSSGTSLEIKAHETYFLYIFDAACCLFFAGHFPRKSKKINKITSILNHTRNIMYIEDE